jgi:NADPH-dependent glutamate synthase beta subunit-like oxidoreductase
VSFEAKEPDLARPGCTYGFQDADVKFMYDGVRDCRAAALLGGGSKVCPIGCIGLGTCARACPFDALSMGPDNLPVVNLAKCTGCGTCERICPKHIITLSSNVRRVQNEYTLEQCTAPCQRHCPAGIEIPRYIREIREGNYLEAVRVIKETNPFPLVCGRICIHPCEYECRRNLVDEPVAINHLKRFAADFEMRSGERVQIPRGPESGKKVVVVGGGAEGLTAGYFLNRLGHEASVYEGSGVLGGLLRTGLPENRLPRNVLDYEINGILEAGVQAKMNQKLGQDFSIESLLKEGYQAVLVVTGGWDTLMSEKERSGVSDALPGIQLLLDFILGQRAGKKPSTGRSVMILGGGKAGLEAARACLEEGAKSVRMVFRKSRNQTSFSEEELAQAERGGIQLHFDSAVTQMRGEGSALRHVEIAHLGGQKNSGGDYSRVLIEVDVLVTGAGRFPELIYVPEQKETETADLLAWRTLVPYPSPYAEQDIGIFRPGEATGDYKAVVEAIGAGRRAAASIQRYLTGQPVEAPFRMIRKTTRVLNLKELEPITTSSRTEMPERTQDERIAAPSAEIVLGYSEDQAKREANRCLQCGLICYRRPGQSGLH